MFNMLSMAIFGSESNSVRVRETIVQHILTHYEEYCGFIIRGHDRRAENQEENFFSSSLEINQL
jgi:hypothetical protein